LISGILLVFRPELAGDVWQGTLDLFIGFLLVVVGVALLQGNALARAVATVVLVLNIIAGVFTTLSQPISVPWAGGLAAGVLALVALVLLWTRRASAFFHNG
jgi:uncharacterized membrane protein